MRMTAAKETPPTTSPASEMKEAATLSQMRAAGRPRVERDTPRGSAPRVFAAGSILF